MERGTGIEPAALAWKARVLPLYEPRNRGQLKNQRPATKAKRLQLLQIKLLLVEGEGFEPSYSERTDLQSVAFNHSATPPNRTRDYADFCFLCQPYIRKKGSVLCAYLKTLGLNSG